MGCEVWYAAIVGSSMRTRWGTSFWFYGLLMASIRVQGKAAFLAHSPKYTGTPYTTGAAPLRYRK
jgi:hypothetical protein